MSTEPSIISPLNNKSLIMKNNAKNNKGLTMYVLEDDRKADQTPCRILSFTTVTIHGNIQPEDTLPTSFQVQLVPSSITRLIDAWHALQGGIQIAGITIRDSDVIANLADNPVKDARLLLTTSGQDAASCELHCFCKKSGCCFIGELELRKQWFKMPKT